MVSSLEFLCSLEIRDLDCPTKKVEVEEVFKRECPARCHFCESLKSITAEQYPGDLIGGQRAVDEAR